MEAFPRLYPVISLSCLYLYHSISGDGVGVTVGVGVSVGLGMGEGVGDGFNVEVGFSVGVGLGVILIVGFRVIFWVGFGVILWVDLGVGIVLGEDGGVTPQPVKTLINKNKHNKIDTIVDLLSLFFFNIAFYLAY